MESHVSNEHLKLLQLVSSQGVLLVSNSNKAACEYLLSGGYIDIFDIPLAKTEIKESGNILTLDFDDSILAIQITEKGKAYVDAHVYKKKTVKAELIISIGALISSVVFGILGLFF